MNTQTPTDEAKSAASLLRIEATRRQLIWPDQLSILISVPQ
jgi:hypothetical protein